MVYKEILVIADHTDLSLRRINFAARLAARIDAELHTVFPVSQFLRFFGEESGATPSLATDSRLPAPEGERVPALHHETRRFFDTQLSEFKLSGKWIEVDGDDNGPLLSLARVSDLVITPREMVTPYSENRQTAAQLGLSCGGPVIVVPPEAGAGEPARRIVVAWADKREAARVLRDAWPLIEMADEVSLVTVGASLKPVEETLRQRFERRGQSVRLVEIEGRDGAAPDLILDYAMSSGADMLVMGLFGRPRVQQWLLGGMTSEMLARCPIPLFASR